MRKKILAVLASAALCVGMLPTCVLADVEEVTGDEAVAESVMETTEAGEDFKEDAAVLLDADAKSEETGGDEEPAVVAEPADVSAGDEAETDAAAEESDVIPEMAAAEEAGAEDGDEKDKVFAAASNGIIVEVTAPAGALPEDAELVVERYAVDSGEYKEAAEAIDYEIKDDNNTMAALDISFCLDGEEVEPAEPVRVSIDVSQILPGDADAGSIEVQHLVEHDYDDEVTPVVVANDSDYTEGTVDEENATAKFEVSSFSTFTVEWNDGTEDTITVHVYNINGTSIDEELDEASYLIADNGTITISEIVAHLEQNASYTSTYTFAYATVYYENTNNQGGFDPYTIGEEDNSVTQISKSGTSYTVNYGTDSSTTLNDPYVVTIHLYYSLPTVTITATENDDDTVDLTTENSYFSGEVDEAEYHWALSDDAYGSITPGGNGSALFTWSEDAAAGDQVSVTVTMTLGNETASDTYTLIYGRQSTTVTVTVNGTAQANANVALVDENGNTAATGKTGADGTITLNVIPGTYTVGVTYVTYNTMGGGSTTRYTNSGTVTVADDGTITGDTTVDLTNSVTSGPGGDTNGSGSGTWSADDEYYYEHIDVKVAVAEGADADAVFSDLDRVYVYDEYGNLIYYSLDLVENGDTTDYNGLFDVNGTEGHSLVISSRDTIILVFEVYENGEYKTYSETITPGTTYPEEEYYSYSDVNAYQLYNSMNGTAISESDWETALNNGTLEDLLGDGYDPNGIDIGGMSFIQVADFLCDTRGTSGQAGLDFVIDVGLMSVLYETYDLQIAKSLEEVPDSVTSVETFEFTLQELSAVSDSDTYTEGTWDTVNNAIGDPASASTGELTKEADGTWSAVAGFGDFLGYEAEEGTTLFYYVLGEKDAANATAKVQYYGIKVSVEYSSATGIATVTASYCELAETEVEGVYNRNSGWTGLTAYTGEEDGSTYTYFSIPFINTYRSTTYPVDIFKYVTGENGDQTGLADAEFVLQNEDGWFAVFTEEDAGYVFSQWTESEEDATTLTSGEDGYIHLTDLEAGTYSLTETKAPYGYVTPEEPVEVEITEEDDAETPIVVNVENTLILTGVEGTKTWNDNDNQDGYRPESITIYLLADGEVADSRTVTEADGWSYSFTDLPMYKDGTEIAYTIMEDAVDHYGTEYDNYDLINNHTPDQTSVSVTKVWEDAGDQDGIRPESVTVQLYADGEAVEGSSLTLEESNGWTGSFTELDIYQNEGERIVYTIAEVEVPDGYECTIEAIGDSAYAYAVTNTYNPPETVTGPEPEETGTDSPDKVNPGSGSPTTSDPTTSDPTTAKGGKTDDPNHMGLWFVLLIAGCALAAGGVTARTRRVRQR